MLNLTPLISTSSKIYYVHCQTIAALDSDRKTSWLLFLAKDMLKNISLAERIK